MVKYGSEREVELPCGCHDGYDIAEDGIGYIVECKGVDCQRRYKIRLGVKHGILSITITQVSEDDSDEK